nr:radical SAM family heme chaperone HemW [uncultured Holophaga sp.]
MKAALAPHLDGLRQAVRAEPLGLYLHVPFCRSRCSYCSFTSTTESGLLTPFAERLVLELGAWGEALERPGLDTLYLGGGTPSLLPTEVLTRITGAIRRSFDLAPLTEATLEANPGTLSPAWLERALELGWNRLSLGVQTLDPALLRRLGRGHNPEEALGALAMAREAGFRRLSGDLMLGVPGQDHSRILEDAGALVEAGAEHLSIYMLDLDKDCPLRHAVDAGRLSLPSDDEVADAFEHLQEALPRLGLLPYEISNYARAGAESRHNTRYWERRPYLGLGPSAASQVGTLRWTEAEDLQSWLAGSEPSECQELSPGEALAEIPLLGLRMASGVDWGALRATARAKGLEGLVDGWERGLERCSKAGLLLREGAQLKLSPKGRLMSNAVLGVFV